MKFKRILKFLKKSIEVVEKRTYYEVNNFDIGGEKYQVKRRVKECIYPDGVKAGDMGRRCPFGEAEQK